jgi:sialic acid synthase SpsE
VKEVPEISIGRRKVGPGNPPLVIAEIGINHEGDFAKAVRMVEDAAHAGAE